MKQFSEFHPITLFCFFASIITLSMFINNPVIAAISLLGGIVYNIMDTDYKDIIQVLKLCLPMMVLIIITNPLFSHSGVTPIFYIGGTALTLESFLYGVSLALTVASVIIWFRNFNRIMTSEKYLFIFGKTMPKVTLVMSSALNFIPRLVRQSQKVRRAQKAMGMYTSTKPIARVKAHLRVFSSVVGWALEHAIETSKAMRSRGGELSPRTNYSVFSFKIKDCVLTVVSVLLFAVIVIGAATGKTMFVFYPKIVVADFSVTSFLCYCSFAVLSFLPFFVEVEGNVKWHYYKSKI